MTCVSVTARWNILLPLILLSCIRSELRILLVACCYGVNQWQPCGGVFDQVIFGLYKATFCESWHLISDWGQYEQFKSHVHINSPWAGIHLISLVVWKMLWKVVLLNLCGLICGDNILQELCSVKDIRKVSIVWKLLMVVAIGAIGIYMCMVGVSSKKFPFEEVDKLVIHDWRREDNSCRRHVSSVDFFQHYPQPFTYDRFALTPLECFAWKFSSAVNPNSWIYELSSFDIRFWLYYCSGSAQVWLSDSALQFYILWTLFAGKSVVAHLYTIL